MRKLLATILSVIMVLCGSITIGEETASMMAEESFIIEDVCEFAIVETKIDQDIKPENIDFVYTHYEAESGKKYVDVVLTYKNLAPKGVVAADFIDGLLIYNDKYEYEGFMAVETDNRSSFDSYYKIAPLCTEYIHYLFEVPDEVANSNESLVALLNIHDTEYKVVVR